MILMDEMIPLRLYSSKQRAYLPFLPKNKKKGSMITVLSRSLQDTIDIINYPTFMNPNYYISYYMERNVKLYLSNDGKIEIEGEQDDPDVVDESYREAVLYAAPNKNSPTIGFVSAGTQTDQRLLEDYFDRKEFNKWYEYFHVEKHRRKYPAVYGCQNMKEMFDAIGDSAIMDHGKLIANSYNSDREIFVLNNSEYAFDHSDGPYKLYCAGALITYVISVSCPRCSWELANHVATALSGQAEYIYEDNNYKLKDEKISVALYVNKLREEKGDFAVVNLCKSGNPKALARLGAKDLISKFTIKYEQSLEDDPNMDVILTESAGLFFEFTNPFKKKDKDKKAEDKSWLKNDKGKFDPFWMFKQLAADNSKKNVKRPYKDVSKDGSYEDLHPWLLSLAENAKDMQRIKYLRADAYTGINQMSKLKQRMEMVQKGTPDKYTNVKYIQKMLDGGNSPEKVQAHINWLKGEYLTALNKRAKEIREEQKATKNEGALLETDGTPAQVGGIIHALNHQDRVFLDEDFDEKESAKAIYRHVIRDGLFGVKGFIEIHNSDLGEPVVVIAVHPKYRKEGVGTELVKTMLREFPKENPDVPSIIWNASSKNAKSYGLAEKMGFKLVKKISTQVSLRYEFKENPLYKLIPDDIVNEWELVKFCRNKFKITYAEPTSQAYVIRDLKTIMRSRNINKYEVGYLCMVALRKISYKTFYAVMVENGSSSAQIGDIEPVVYFANYEGKNYYCNPFNPTFGSSGVLKADEHIPVLTLFGQLHDAEKWGHREEFDGITCAACYNKITEIPVGKSLYQDIIVPVIKQNLSEGAITELSVHSKLEPPIFPASKDKLPMRISRLKKIKIDEKVVEQYGNQMEGLRHVRLTNSCTGYLYVNRKDDTPVCYYNVQEKDPDDDGNPTIWLQAMEVGEDFKERSLGKQLLEEAMRAGATNLSVNKDNAVAIRLYKSMGFRIYDASDSMYHMRKKFPKIKKESWRPPESMTMQLEDMLFIFDDGAEIPLAEDLSQTAYNTKLRQYLWKERVRTSSAQIQIYNQVKAACPRIRKAFVKPEMYKGLNLFMDMSYYNGLFLNNNKTKKDIAIKFYWEYLSRMLGSMNDYFRSAYTKNTVMIPVWSGAWDCKPNTFVYDWKENLNPISLIFRMIRKSPEELRKWGNLNFIFVGRKGYFRVNFGTFQLKDLVKFKMRLNKLWAGEDVEDDEEADGYGRKPLDIEDEEHSAAAIAVKVIDDIEQSTGVEINNVSNAVAKSRTPIPGNELGMNTPDLKIQIGRMPAATTYMDIGMMTPSVEDTAEASRGMQLDKNAINFGKYPMRAIYRP